MGMLTLLALASLGVVVVALAGAWQIHVGISQNWARAQRSALDEVESRASRPLSRLDGALRRTRAGHAMEVRLAGAGLGLGVADLVLIGLGGVGLAVIAVLPFAGRVAAVLAAVAVVAGGFAWLRHRRKERSEQFIGQLPELARVLSNAASAGLALRTAIAMAADELSDPASSELRRVADALQVGHSIDEALSSLQERLPSRELGVLVTTLVIQHRTGGTLVAALRNLSEALEARKDLHREIKTLTAGSVFTSYLVAGMGAGTLLLLNVINPGVLDKMTSSPVGEVALLVAAGLYALGFFLIQRISRVED